jgi:hypothetical protein
MQDALKIDKVVFRNKRRGHQAECTVHYHEHGVPNAQDILIEEIHNGHSHFHFSFEAETLEVSSGGKVITLNANNLARASAWYSRNTPISIPLPT